MSCILPSFAVAIPTKNRPVDLAATIESLFAQSALPNQLVIIDQSTNEESKRRVMLRYDMLPWVVRDAMKLLYVHDVSITGLTAARNRALGLVQADIVLFLDDDVILEPDFDEQIMTVYRERPEAVGVSGVVTNYSAPGMISRLWSRVFMTGPFWDDRQPVYWNADLLRGTSPIRVTRLGGGLMSFRLLAIGCVEFDEGLKGSCDGEDVDFCARMPRQTVLLITPKARLAHKQTSTARLTEHWLPRHTRTMWYLYRRNWNCGVWNRCCFVWLNLGYAVAALCASFRRCSFRLCADVLRAGRGSWILSAAGTDEPSSNRSYLHP